MSYIIETRRKSGMWGKHHTAETKRRISLAKKGRPLTPEALLSRREKTKKRYESGWISYSKGKTFPERQGKNNPLYGKPLLEATKIKLRTNHWTTRSDSDEIRVRIRATKKERFASGETVPWCKGLKIPHGKPSWNSGKTAKEDNRIPHNKTHGMFGRTHNKKTCQKMSEISLKRWREDEKYRKRVKRGLNKFHNMKPNNCENQVVVLLDKLYPGEWRYSGDWSFWIDGKNPDFVNVNGQKKLIEVFGDHWHEPEKEEQRKAHFKQFGFDTLVIWEHELKDLRTVEQRLLEFHNK